MKIDKIYSSSPDITSPYQLPFIHCLEGNGINQMTLQWCEKHTLGKWAYWFDRQHCLDNWDMTAQIAYIGFTNSIDLFMFRISAPDTITDRQNLSKIII